MDQTWDESMATGDPHIDEQHREILTLVDGLESVQEETGDPDTIYGVLGSVMDVTVTHFAMEEALMRAVNYPAKPSAEMIFQHREFTAYARLRVLEFRSGGMHSILPLRDFLVEWLVDHEFGLDRQLVDWIRSTGAEPPALSTIPGKPDK